MRFTLEIDCDNAAFGETDDERMPEIDRILGEVRERLNVYGLEQHTHFWVRDVNGNPVAKVRMD